MDGLLLVHKPIGISSYDVIRHLKKSMRQRHGGDAQEKLPKIGHGGTLDPFAEGLLVVLLGRATKLSSRMMELKKTYEGEVCLGEQRNTDDVTGQALRCKTGSDIPAGDSRLALVRGDWPSLEEIKTAAQGFGGRQFQIPPAFSALHHQGERLYDLARRGQLIELPAREVHLYEVSIGRYQAPKFEFAMEVGKGFYVRSWARDMGLKLQCGAYLKSLKRKSIGPFYLNDASALEEVADYDHVVSRVISYDESVQLLA